jgi:ribosome-associated protein
MTDAEQTATPAPASPGLADDLLDPTFPIAAARAAFAKGATDILVLQVGDVLAITDYFVIASASNPRLVRAIVQDCEEAVAAAGGPKPLRVEGLAESEWVLADHGTFVVHVFHQDARQYYELERLWSDVPQIAWEDPDLPAAAASAGTR